MHDDREPPRKSHPRLLEATAFRDLHGPGFQGKVSRMRVSIELAAS
jgi:hypothetical protein